MALTGYKAKKQNQPRCPTAGERLNELLHVAVILNIHKYADIATEKRLDYPKTVSGVLSQCWDPQSLLKTSSSYLPIFCSGYL